MKIKTFTFVPDNHYAYPEIVHDSTRISTKEELLRYYEAADCTALTMDEDDDWTDDAESAFMQFGYNSYYENLYIIVYAENIGDEEIRNYIEEVHIDNMDNIISDYDDLPNALWTYESEDNPWINGKISNDFLKKLVEREDVVLAISLGNIKELASNKRHPKIEMDEIFSNILDELVVKEFRKGDKNIAGKNYTNFANIIDGIDTLLSPILSADEMKNLKNIGRSHSILGMFK